MADETTNKNDDKVEEVVNEAEKQVNDKVEEVAEAGKEIVNEAEEKVNDGAEKVAEAVEEVVSEVEEKVSADKKEEKSNKKSSDKKKKTFRMVSRSEILRSVEAKNIEAFRQKEEAPKEEEAQQQGKKKKKNKQKKDERYDFVVGDTVKVWVKIIEGQGKKMRERLQGFEGIVIGMNGKGIAKSFTVRKISFGVGVERVFPFHSPLIGRVEITRKGKVRRAKLYYLRDRIGKAAQVKRKETRFDKSKKKA